MIGPARLVISHVVKGHITGVRMSITGLASIVNRKSAYTHTTSSKCPQGDIFGYFSVFFYSKPF